MGITRMKAVELVLDYNLWPRQSVNVLDQTNIARMKAALRNGFSLPPVIVNAKDMRVVDGFHRTTAVMSVYGDAGEIDVELREYGSEAEMFLDAGRLNAHHGLPMNSKDRAHFIMRCRKMKIPPKAIAEALHIDTDSMKKFIENRIAYSPTGDAVPLPAGTNLGGKTLTPEQEHFARHSDGARIMVHVSILINALKADVIELDEKAIGRLSELRDLLDGIVCEAA